ncbi:hypothetical protein IAU59_002610 [Kwoniella sp. CBS 9459]
MAPSMSVQPSRLAKGVVDANGSSFGVASTSASAPGDALPSRKQEQEESTGSEPQPKIRKKRLDVNPSLIISDGRSKRRRTPSPQPENAHENAGESDKDPKDPQRAKELGYVIYRRIMDSKDPDGEDMAHPFIKLPNKRAFPDYYETIKHPMSLEMVHAKLDAAEYQTLKSVCTDLGQIFTNAKRYNVKESLLFQYAKKLHKMTRTYYASVTSPEKAKDDSESEGEHEQPSTSRRNTTRSAEPAVPKEEDDGDVDAEGEDDPEGDVDMEATPQADGEDAPASTGRAGRKRGSYMKDGPSVYKLIKPVLKSIKEAKSNDGSGRDVCAIFMQLPDRRELPDYYQTIKNPISLEEIESKQVGRRYESWQEFFSDVELMCTNAMEYNEDESEVYNDAKQIMTLLSQLRRNLLLRLENPQVAKVAKSRLSQSTVSPSPSSRPSHMPSHLQSYGPGYGTPGSSYSPSPAMLSGMGGYPQSPVPIGQYPPHPSMMPHNTTRGPGSARSVYPPGFMGPPNGGPSGPAPGPGPGQGPGPAHAGYLPALPKGIVTEDIVNNLGRYPVYEQQAWAQSLTPLALNMYRSILASLDARRRGEMNAGPGGGMGMGMGVPPPGPMPSPTPSYPHQPLPPQPHSQPHAQPYPYPLPRAHSQTSASPRLSHKPVHMPTPDSPQYPTQTHRPHVPTPSPLPASTPLPSTSSPVPKTQPAPVALPNPAAVAERPKPPVPTVKHLDLHFSSTSFKSSGSGSAPSKHKTQAARLRLRNMRGITSHSLVLNATTSELELTAYIDDGGVSVTSPSKASSDIKGQSTLGLSPNVPDRAGDGSATMSSVSASAPSPPVTMPELSLRINGNSGPLPRFIYSNGSRNSSSKKDSISTTSGDNSIAGAGGRDGEEGRPKGMRWNVHVPTSKMESKIEVVATKPGALTETTTIYVNRQY